MIHVRYCAVHENRRPCVIVFENSRTAPLLLPAPRCSIACHLGGRREKPWLIASTSDRRSSVNADAFCASGTPSFCRLARLETD